MLYGAVYEDSLDAAFAAAEAHGLRVVMGKVMMDRLRYDRVDQRRRGAGGQPRPVAERLIERWHGRDGGRLQYAVTPRFAV